MTGPTGSDDAQGTTSARALEADSSSPAVALVDSFGRVRGVSSAFAAALRIRRDEILAKPLPTLALHADRPALAHALRAVASGEWPGCSLEIRFLQHDRNPRFARLDLSPEASQRVRVHATDLTAARDAQLTLQEYERGLQALTAHALDIWALLGDGGLLRSVSDSVSVHLGWTPRELEGRPLLDFVHTDDRPAVAALLAALKADPTIVRSAVFRALHRDRGWRTLESTTAGFNPGLLGNAVFVLNARDVTARERTESALREVEARFGRLVEQVSAGIVVVQEGRIVYANPRFVELFGLVPDALAARPRALAFVDRGSLRALRRARLDHALGATPTAHAQLRGRRADGGSLDVDVAVSHVEFEGSPALLCTINDVTEAQALQLRMADAEKVEAIGLLAGGVAHDFNNLLMGILAWVDIASDELGDANPVAHALDEIRAASERAAELTRQLLAIGRRQRLDPQPLDLGEVVVQLKRWLDRVLGPEHPLTLDVPSAPWLIAADRASIERALTSLIMNARDAMPDGGDIRVVVTHEQLDAERAEALGPLRPGEHVVVSVRDGGVGMDEATRRRIFEPFFTTKPQGRGLGLGLPSVLGTVLQSGGAIDVKSAPGAGAEFRLHFPRGVDRPAAPTSRTGRWKTPAPRFSRRVLVVAPDPERGRVLRRVLQEGGHSVSLAATAAEARAESERLTFDVLVCEVALPGTSGASLSGTLGGRGSARATVLIVDRDVPAEESAQAGAHTVTLTKPFRAQRLLDAVEDAAVRAGLGASR